MVKTHIPAALRRKVEQRAQGRCEYCQFPQAFALHPHEPDHIIPHQHGGRTAEENLALACFRCNRYKGPNIGSFDSETGLLVAFFHPRTQAWADHFEWDGARVEARTREAGVTVRILRINDPQRVTERGRLMDLRVG